MVPLPYLTFEVFMNNFFTYNVNTKPGEARYMYNILIISEDPSLFAELTDYLRKEFFSVYHHACDEISACTEELRQYDFILLHLNYDKETNIKRIEEAKRHSTCPLYIFSHKHTHEEIVELLGHGSEGHIEIPFTASVVSARIKAVLRYLHQVKPNHSKIMRFGRLVLHMDNREVHIDGNHIPLTNVEFKIFQILVEHRETVVSKDKIIHYVWDEDSSATDNALGIHITRLRKKLSCDPGLDLIETIWGLGYRLNLELCEKQPR
jgi:two-component system KDP operon response regulator KdpE